jgi:hypothetical protein
MGLEVHHRPRKDEPLNTKIKVAALVPLTSHRSFADPTTITPAAVLSISNTQHPVILSEAQRSRRTPKVSTPPKPLEPSTKKALIPLCS